VTEALEEATPSGPGDEPDGRGIRNVIEWITIVAGALAVALVVKTFLIQAFFIPSESMVPTLVKGDRVLVNKLDDSPSRGELVVFERPPGQPDDGIKDLIKRVVALGGETIEARDGVVYVDDVALEERYLADGVTTSNLPRQTIPADHMFVMGDNRGDSADSRVFGPVATDLVVGKAFVRVWPLSAIGFL
jgi:signal peptidase I